MEHSEMCTKYTQAQNIWTAPNISNIITNNMYDLIMIMMAMFKCNEDSKKCGKAILYAALSSLAVQHMPQDTSLHSKSANIVWPGNTENRLKRTINFESRHIGTIYKSTVQTNCMCQSLSVCLWQEDLSLSLFSDFLPLRFGVIVDSNDTKCQRNWK